MPIKSIQKLPSKARALFERTMKGLKGKGYSDAKRAKIAWSVVKKRYKQVNGRWVAKEDTKQKSYPVNNTIHEKSLDGNKFFEGYILTFDPDDDNEMITFDFAKKIQNDLHYGTYFHDEKTLGVLELIESKIDDKGLWGKVKLNKDNKYSKDILSLISDTGNELAFSVRLAVPEIAQEIKKIGDKYVNVLTDGKGLDFGLTNQPVNRKAKAKAL